MKRPRFLPREWPYEWRVGWRYTRAGRATRSNGFISFISGVSMLGIALGVAALIVVLSVMNGFQKEVQKRMLSAVAHIEVLEDRGQALPQLPMLETAIFNQIDVVAVAPFVREQAMLARGEDMRGVQVRGVDPAREAAVTALAADLLPRLAAGRFGVLVGTALADTLGVEVGDALSLLVPRRSGMSGSASAMGAPRVRPLTVVGIFDSGHYEYDSSLALMNLADAQQLFELAGPNGLRLRLDDPDRAPAVVQALAKHMPRGTWLTDWTRQNATWFSALGHQKRLLFLILVLIVAVAAFNLVSMLMMSVVDKRADIAILRTLGAAPRSIMLVFMVQGAMVGILGTGLGLALGLVVALNLPEWIPALEQALGVHFLPKDIYLIDHMPSDPQMGDIAPIVLVSLLLSLLATLYPSWRASQMNPAEALKYE
ncbi:lipoprotein-releasing ABC transporter permease subunit [Hydrogenophaga sp. PAMC20947]|uniref:lipoprotein-releasing ABC transporter permease subunit n=1 Tax=Hydrogenophaga sp. PAMC20947 TaxID=2565558 RepID=UPI00109D8660|nr:lipoprotein-releasing ABC transporter permease subunit [Hydrogenophaga sp. PAMC20947]QCB48390.1 lipoprotein-releasing ABC transporter permease subunit [Hydrogenophaga sp. PAMC20947]